MGWVSQGAWVELGSWGEVRSEHGARGRSEGHLPPPNLQMQNIRAWLSGHPGPCWGGLTGGLGPHPLAILLPCPRCWAPGSSV